MTGNRDRKYINNNRQKADTVLPQNDKSMTQELMEDHQVDNKTEKKLDKYHLTESELIGTSKTQPKNNLNTNIKDVTMHHIKEKAEVKSKVKHIVHNKDQF